MMRLISESVITRKSNEKLDISTLKNHGRNPNENKLYTDITNRRKCRHCKQVDSVDTYIVFYVSDLRLVLL